MDEPILRVNLEVEEKSRLAGTRPFLYGMCYYANKHG